MTFLLGLIVKLDWLLVSELIKKLANEFQNPFPMTSRPVDSFALTAPIKYIMGFPYVIGYQTINVIFINFANGKVAVNAPCKRLDVSRIDTDLIHNLFELLNKKGGRDENVVMGRKRFLNFFSSRNQYSMVLEPGIKLLAGNFRFVKRIIAQNTQPFG
jgi:hypothetical protein